MRRPAAPSKLSAMKVAALLTACLAALTVLAGASAATPAGYRAQVNAICAPYTPKVKRLKAQLTAAQKAQDGQAYGLALGQVIVLQLTEDAQIERVPVPAALAGQMSRILTRLKAIDGHLRLTLAAARAGSTNALVAQLQSVNTLAKPLNGWLDAAGLRECGTRQS
jgi:hypothetical protein